MAVILKLLPTIYLGNVEYECFLNDDSKPIEYHDPLKLLEKSIAACIGRGIVKYLTTAGIGNPFKTITVNISEESIIYHTDIDECWLEEFKWICENCYISEHLSFKKRIVNKGVSVEL